MTKDERIYVVLLNLDQEGAERVREIRRRLGEARIGTSMQEAIPPHVTLGAFGQIDLEAAGAALSSFFGRRRLEPLRFDVLGSFPDTGVLHATPLVTSRLLACHAELHALLAPLTGEPYIYYRPGAWNPHCTIVDRLSRSQLAAAFRFVVEIWEPFTASAAEVALVLPGPETEKLYSMPLGISGPE
jgi:2'-5' RNA ligase